MSTSILILFTTYLIYPILGLIMIVVAALIAKKNGLMKNKRLIAYALLSALLLAVPALLGFLNYNFMPYAYIALTGFYLLTGYLNDYLLPWVFNNVDLKYRIKITFTLFQTLLAMLLFVLLFNLCNELKYGLWASTTLLSFVLPSLLVQSYRIFIYIPTPIYKVWVYDDASGFSAPEELDHSELKVVKVEVFKQEDDPKPTRINTKFHDDMILNDWIKLLLDDYNKQWAHAPIQVSGSDTSGWIFYVKSWALAPRRYLDYELTLKENRIKERHLIVGKRVRNIITQ